MKNCTKKLLMTLSIIGTALLFAFMCILNTFQPVQYAMASEEKTVSEKKEEETYHHQKPTNVDIGVSSYNVIEILGEYDETTNSIVADDFLFEDLDEYLYYKIIGKDCIVADLPESNSESGIIAMKVIADGSYYQIGASIQDSDFIEVLYYEAKNLTCVCAPILKYFEFEGRATEKELTDDELSKRLLESLNAKSEFAQMRYEDAQKIQSAQATGNRPNRVVSNTNASYPRYTDTDGIIKNYLNLSMSASNRMIYDYYGKAHKHKSSGENLSDDPITKIIPKSLFSSTGTTITIGLEYGFYINTYNSSDKMNNSKFLVFDIESEKLSPKTTTGMVQIKPLFGGTATYVKDLKVVTVSSGTKLAVSDVVVAVNLSNKDGLNFGDSGYDGYKDYGYFVSAGAVEAHGTSCSYGNSAADFAKLAIGTVMGKIPKYGGILKTVFNATTTIAEKNYKAKTQIATNQNVIQFIENANALSILSTGQPLPKAFRMELKDQGNPEATNRTPLLYKPFNNGNYYFKLQYQVDQRDDAINWDTLVSTQIELSVVEDNTSKNLFGKPKGTLDLCAHTMGGFVEEYNNNPIRDTQSIDADIFYGAEFGYGQKYKEFEFTPNCNYDYVIETRGTIPTYLFLLDANELLLVSTDEQPHIGINARLVYHLIGGKTYKIRVEEYHIGLGSTALIVHKIDTITELGRGYSSAFEGARQYTYDSIWFEFKPMANAIYTISTASGSSMDTYLTVYDENLNVIAFDDDSGEGRFALLDMYLLQGKTYYIKANTYNNNSSGNFTTIVTRQQMLPKYADWELNNGEYIYYRITVPDLTTGSYKMSAFARSGSTNDTYLTLLDNSFNYMTHNDDRSSSDRSSEIIYTLEAGKTYYLQLRLFSTSANAEGMIEIEKI